MLADIVIRGVDLQWFYGRGTYALAFLAGAAATYIFVRIVKYPELYKRGRDDEKHKRPWPLELGGDVAITC
jgi:hypothetical protein